MSFVDLIGILLIISLCYIGYLKGFKRQLFFIGSLTSSCLLLHLFFNPLFLSLNLIFKNKTLSGFFLIILIILPIFILTEWALRKLFITEVVSFSSSKMRVGFISRLFASLVSFVFGYILIFFLMQTFKTPPLENSFFYNAIIKNKEKEEKVEMLNAIYIEKTALELSLSKDEIQTITKMIKAISSQKAQELLTFLQNATPEEGIAKLTEFYEQEKGEINPNIQRFRTIKRDPKPEVQPTSPNSPDVISD